MADRTFYRRPLPPPAIAFASPEGRRVFREALAEGTMEGWFPLAEQFHTQAEPAYCGLGTLVTVLNALALDPGRAWRGPWRWYGEELLDCCRPLDDVKVNGVTLGEFACLARCNGARAEVKRAESATLDELRAHVREACATPGGSHVVAAYSRKVLGQTGDGHYSPIGGYHPGQDLALVLDVARFKYPPHWVPLPLLWEAMQPPDPATGKSRGYLRIRRGEEAGVSLCRVTSSPSAWRALSAEIREELPAALERAAPRSLEEAVQALVRAISPRLISAIELREGAYGAADEGETDAIAARERGFLTAVLETSLSRLVAPPLEGRTPLARDEVRRLMIVTLLLLACPSDVFATLPGELRAPFEELRAPEALPPVVAAEIGRLGEQMAALDAFCCSAR